MKRFLYVFYVVALLIIFIPKERIYFSIEAFLSDYHVFINNENFTNHLIYLDVENAALALDNQSLASIQKIQIAPFLFFNRLSISNLSFSPYYHSFFPGSVDAIVLTYSILAPFEISIQGKGDFGQFRGEYDIINHKIRIVFEPTYQLRQYGFLVSKLHQEKEGLIYENTY